MFGGTNIVGINVLSKPLAFFICIILALAKFKIGLYHLNIMRYLILKMLMRL